MAIDYYRLQKRFIIKKSESVSYLPPQFSNLLSNLSNQSDFCHKSFVDRLRCLLIVVSMRSRAPFPHIYSFLFRRGFFRRFFCFLLSKELFELVSLLVEGSLFLVCLGSIQSELP